MSQKLIIRGTELKSVTPSGRVLYDNISFVLPAGHVLLVSGPNGSGKSTLLWTLLNKTKPSSGICESYVSEAEIAFVPQMQNLEFYLPMSLKEVIDLSQNREIDRKLIDKIGLLAQDKLALSWNTASGGERQRTLLTCALLSNPKLLVLDEPLNHLDAETHQLTSETLYKFVSEEGGSERAVILASHVEMDHFRQLDEKIVRLELGDNV